MSRSLLKLLLEATHEKITVSNTGTDPAVEITNTGNSTPGVLSLTTTGAGPSLYVLLNAASGNPNAQFVNAGSGENLLLDQNGNGPALGIDSEATSQPLIALAPVVGNTRGDIAFGTVRTSDPSSASEGDFWYNSTAKVFKYHNGTGVTTLATA